MVALYFATPQRWRWILLLAASYLFYAAWKAEYLVLIIASTAVDYFVALAMARWQGGARKALLALSIATNLGMLFAFKYANFVSESVQATLNNFQIMIDVPGVHLLLPVGISFYTFQSMSYTFDVYRGAREPERHAGIFALYVAFFPQLVAGPIERATHLLPQFREHHRWDTARVADGLQLMLWGMFKKVVIADRLALYVDAVFNNPTDHSGLPIVIAAYFFAFQIYCDFSGYSDIAIGAARVMGYDIMRNFRRPYMANTIAEFWRRWHISLTTWFRDYLYIPLGGNRVGPARWMRNVIIVFLVSGLWHGANWTFIVWGALHAAYYAIEYYTGALRDRFNQKLGLARIPRVHHALQVVITFHLVVAAWFFFRADTIANAWTLLIAIPTGVFFNAPWAYGMPPEEVILSAILIAALLIIEGIDRGEEARSPFAAAPTIPRAAFCYAAAMAILIFGKSGASSFIYFQF